MQVENKIIRDRYVNDPRMAKAYNLESAHKFIVKSLEKSNPLDRVRLLFCGMMVSPSVLGSRFFWGAIKRLHGTKR